MRKLLAFFLAIVAVAAFRNSIHYVAFAIFLLGFISGLVIGIFVLK